MYFDEDGDLAHEFYEEVAPKRKGGRRKMRRVVRNLVPQVRVLYSCTIQNSAIVQVYRRCGENRRDKLKIA